MESSRSEIYIYAAGYSGVLSFLFVSSFSSPPPPHPPRIVVSLWYLGIISGVM